MNKRVAILIAGLVACGDNDTSTDAGIDARLEGFDKPELVCPGAASCANAGDGTLLVGAGKRVWTPPIAETYTDEDNDRTYDRSEPFVDANGNGKFDGVWLFGGARAAFGVTTDVEARAIAFVQGDTTVVVLSVDAVGINITDMDRIRRHTNLDGLAIDHVLITATHAHEAPDTMGLWGPTETETGRQPFVLESLYQNASLAVRDAVMAVQPATMTIASTKLINDPANPQSRTDDFNQDIRDPVIFDPTLTIARFAKVAAPSETIATLVNWADHPEVARNVMGPPTITAHYPHWIRKGVEDGVRTDQSKYATSNLPGLGGIAVFVQGALGGQVGSLHGTHPPGPDGTPITVEDHTMEQAIGTNAAALALTALAQGGESTSVLPLSFKTARFHARVENTLLTVAYLIGLLGTDSEGALVGYDKEEPIDVGNYPWVRLRATYLQIGPLGVVSVPGELHPELWVGGFDGSWSWGWPLYDPAKPNPPRFDEAPPPPYMRDLVLAHDGVRYPVVVGLAESYCGYIVPAYNYNLDPENPFLREAEGDHYEESYSVGPLVEQHAIHPILDLLRVR